MSAPRETAAVTVILAVVALIIGVIIYLNKAPDKKTCVVIPPVDTLDANCDIETCINGYARNASGSACAQVGGACIDADYDENYGDPVSSVQEYGSDGGCKLVSCRDGYRKSDRVTNCVEITVGGDQVNALLVTYLAGVAPTSVVHATITDMIEGIRAGVIDAREAGVTETFVADAVRAAVNAVVADGGQNGELPGTIAAGLITTIEAQTTDTVEYYETACRYEWSPVTPDNTDALFLVADEANSLRGVCRAPAIDGGGYRMGYLPDQAGKFEQCEIDGEAVTTFDTLTFKGEDKLACQPVVYSGEESLGFSALAPAGLDNVCFTHDVVPGHRANDNVCYVNSSSTPSGATLPQPHVMSNLVLPNTGEGDSSADDTSDGVVTADDTSDGVVTADADNGNGAIAAVLRQYKTSNNGDDAFSPPDYLTMP